MRIIRLKQPNLVKNGQMFKFFMKKFYEKV